MHAPPGQLINFWRQEFEHRIDDVCAHGVLHIHNQVDDEHRSHLSFRQDAGLQIEHSPAIFLDVGVKSGNRCQQFIFVRQHLVCGCLRVRQIKHLQLADHLLGGHAGFKTTAGSGKFCHEGNSGDHRRLFDHHRD